MFERMMLSAFAASSLLIATPALAGEGPPVGWPFETRPAGHASGEDRQASSGRGEMIVEEKVSADAAVEGEQVPAGFDTPARAGHDPLDRSMDAGG